MYTEPTTFSAEEYFATQPAPATLQQELDRVRTFIERQRNEGRNVVLVTVSADVACLPTQPLTVYDRAGVLQFRWSSMCEPVLLSYSQCNIGLM